MGTRLFNCRHNAKRSATIAVDGMKRLHNRIGRKDVLLRLWTLIALVIVDGATVAQESGPNLGTTAAVSGALFLPTLLTGYWMSSDATPNDALLAGHKISSGANLVLLNYTAVKMHQIEPLSPSEFSATIFMNLCFAGTIATGALMTVNDDRPTWVSRFHGVAPYVTIASSGTLLWLLSRNPR